MSDPKPLRSSSYGSFANLAGASSGRSEGLLAQLANLPNLLAMVIAFLFVFVIIGFLTMRMARNSGCLPPPYLYVTSTGQHNIVSITRDGCVVLPKALWMPELAHHPLDLRSMAMGTWGDSVNNESALFVANAATTETNVLVFKSPLYWNGLRPYVASIMSNAPNSPFRTGAVHAYGLTFDPQGNLYVSYEKTNVVLRASAGTWLPMPPPLYPYLRVRNDPVLDFRLQEEVVGRGYRNSSPLQQPSPPQRASLAPGTFLQFDSPGLRLNESDTGVRALAWAGSYLWVANEDDRAVFIVDSDGRLIHTIPTSTKSFVGAGSGDFKTETEASPANSIGSPIGLLHIPYKHLVLVSSKGKHSGGVFAFQDSAPFSLVRSYTLISMRHPRGMAVWDDVLYVADQGVNGILTFKLTTGRYIRTVYTISDDKGVYLEHLALMFGDGGSKDLDKSKGS